MERKTVAKGSLVGPGSRLLFAVGTFLLCVKPLAAATVYIGGGWQATWDAGFDGLVQIDNRFIGSNDGVVNTGAGDAIFIQKSAEFTSGPNPGTGLFSSIPITFMQVAEDAVSFIVLEDEIITNSTGTDWTGFQMTLLNGGDVWYRDDYTADPVLSGGPGPIGWSIDPFQQAAFSPDKMQLDIYDGVVAAGQTWFPGDTPSNGNLWIEINTMTGTDYVNNGGTTFTLKETPVPEPTTMALLGLGGVALLRRRRAL